MIRILSIFLATLVLQGCNFSSETAAISANLDTQRVWVYMQVNVPEEGGIIDSYYYFAEVSEPIFSKIKNNELSQGFIYLKGVRYWGPDDVIHQYRDSENQGDIVFRIEDIRLIKRVNAAPEIGKGIEQYSEEEAAQLTERDAANAQD